jgi:hypothetical protein
VNFKNPRESSTNYLSAYNAQGQLKRVVDAARDRERGKREEEEAAIKEGRPARDTPPQDAAIEGSSDPDDPKGRREPREPPETTRDLIPFPLNRTFVSQPVLSGRMREEIWERIMKQGKSVTEVSAELGVELARVGAVVRLKEIEKEWVRIVSSSVDWYLPPNTFMMIYKNSISLQDNYMVTKFTHASLSDCSSVKQNFLEYV